jgi:hypothetical protein
MEPISLIMIFVLIIIGWLLLKLIGSLIKVAIILIVLGFIFYTVFGGSFSLGFFKIDSDSDDITNFQECIDAGNPAMESYPRQCRAGDNTFTEDIAPILSYEEALEIAQAECMKVGNMQDNYTYNAVTRTWWFDFSPNSAISGCNPACVVMEDNNTADINWRCTGVLPE